MIQVNTKGFDRLVLADERLKPAFKVAAFRASALLRSRVSKQGRKADGSKLPQVEPDRGWFWTSNSDTRFDSQRSRFFWSLRHKKGYRWVYGKGYHHLKKKMGLRTHVAAPLTGDMWRSMAASFRKGRGDALIATVGFRKSSVVGVDPTPRPGSKKPKNIRVENRVKAKMVQFKKRPGGSVYKTVGRKRIFTIMELSPGEINLLQTSIANAIKFRR